MVSQANNNIGSLVAYYNQMKNQFGSWMALRETSIRAKKNLTDETEYRRSMAHSFEYEDWKIAHQFGRDYSRMYASNSSTLCSLLAANRRPYHVDSRMFSKLIEKALYKRDSYGDPIYAKCFCCSRIVMHEDAETTIDGEPFCVYCRDNGFVRHSECMNGYIHADRSVSVYHDAYAVENDERDWATSGWCLNNEYRRRTVRGTTAWYSEEALEVVSELGGIYGYHSGPDLPKIISDEWAKRKPLVLLGMELEVENVCSDDDEDESNEDIATSIYKAIGKEVKHYMKCENDGSLDNGFEIITAPTGLDTHAKALAQLRKAEHFDQIHSHTTSTCGLHVHVCKAGMTVLHAAKLQAFINSEANEKLVRCVARRYQTGGSGYAKIEQHEDWIKHMGRVAGPHIRQAKTYKEEFNHRTCMGSNFVHDRYSALNFRNDHTVEFRLFRGTTKYESIMACLEFAYACWFFTREASVKELTTENFMKFITRADNRKDTKHLRAYLKAKKFRAFYQAEQIARPKFKEQATSVQEGALINEEPEHIPLSITARAGVRPALAA